MKVSGRKEIDGTTASILTRAILVNGFLAGWKAIWEGVSVGHDKDILTWWFAVRRERGRTHKLLDEGKFA